jgi:hypothetical protein
MMGRKNLQWRSLPQGLTQKFCGDTAGMLCGRVFIGREILDAFDTGKKSLVQDRELYRIQKKWRAE